MGQNDKSSDAANQAKEKAKQWLNNKSQQGKQSKQGKEGGAGKTTGGLKQAAEHAKDAVREAREAIRNR